MIINLVVNIFVFFSKILLMNNAIDQVKKNVKIEWNQLQVEVQHLQKVQ
jgi:hypothetical protein